MVSVCIPTFNRTDLLFESFSRVIDDDRISEIVIVDDCSTDEVWVKMCNTIGNHPKIKLFRNEKNLDCYRNKREAVSKASNEWVYLLDSDNTIYPDTLDAIFKYEWNPKTIYQPEYARPLFDFRQFSGQKFNRSNIAKFIEFATFGTMMNAMNYFVNRDEYLRDWDGSVDPVTSDSIFQNYNMIKNGCEIFVVPGMQYDHAVHKGSHYQNNILRTPLNFHKNVINSIKKLR